MAEEKNLEDEHWICTICGFEAGDEQEKKDHLEKTKSDPAHQIEEEE